MQLHLPVVTLIVPFLDERPYLEACLRSIRTQDYPADRLEVLVYDGGSTDGSDAIARGIADRDPRFVLLPNPARTQAAAWNAGIDRACGDVIGIVSAHAELETDYVSTAVATLDRTGADMVGGPVRAIADTAFGAAVAAATSTPFGVGGARFRYVDEEQDVDTVFKGVCRAETYRRFRFDEAMVRNQDDELSYRILDAGGRIVCDPAIRSLYRARTTWRGLARQYYAYGFWKVRVMERHPRQVRPRHLVPAAFVAGLVGSVAAAALVPPLRVLPVAAVGAYATATAAVTGVVGRRLPASVAIRLPLAYATLHVAYGVGTWTGALDLLRRRSASR